MEAKNVLKVIKNLEKVLPQAQHEENLNMGCPFVNKVGNSKYEKCGTIHCHGGWYAIATMKMNVERTIHYDNGANLMAKHLGLINIYALRDWAEQNPKIWGNKRGDSMFRDPIAFKTRKRKEGAKNLQHIIDHWKEVHNRLVKLENPVYKDITKDLAVLPPDEKVDHSKKVKKTKKVELILN